ncbi:hypothetical protein IRY61_01350 [Candidatus Saccharibacteria bacterium]|nr:hypothetical protein [Candidatus Saccharibacteria bacterium]
MTITYYAIENGIGTGEVPEGGIEITAEQYSEALDAIAEGYVISVEGGELAFIAPQEPEPEPEEPEEPEPEEPELTPEEELQRWRDEMQVSRLQARMALHTFGLFDAVDAMMNDPETPLLYREAWLNAQYFRRMSPTVLAMADKLGLSEGQLDELFLFASSIEA